ncbi:hypothetical protein [Novosphingobium resinovorum]|jgi:hypothetical protein|uniref:Outer membrane protein beta-barrel domain-containing protein n=2 Tax=Sphingomonadaceae TaxID=41297 RepID=A0A031K1Y0_9SPHN|nr:hypothetical protein [Novosphingobium resinovorum]AOR76276.1 hypothetical protein BES08_05515 [Novosphingobium resinovorum]EZP83214.1 hypothetical protein BV97_01320 [Novosphingobium resinovorum]
MTLKQIAWIAGLLMASWPPAVCHAQDTRGGVTIAAAGGSLGIGPEVGFRLSEIVGVRASATFLGLGHNVDVDDINYHGDLKLRSWGANADLYPFRNCFRLSAGFRVSSNRIDLVATPSEAVTVGQRVYTPEEIGTIEGKVRARRFVPTFTVGFAKNRENGFAWSLDAGVMLHGRPRTEDVVATGELASNPLFQEDLARERGEIENEVDNYKVYPIVQLSVGYTF